MIFWDKEGLRNKKLLLIFAVDLREYNAFLLISGPIAQLVRAPDS